MSKQTAKVVASAPVDRPCECGGGCDWEGHESDIPEGLGGVENLFERIDPGCEVPVGECPECGCLAYLKERVKRKQNDLLESLRGVLRYCVTVNGMPDKNKGRTAAQQSALDKARAAISKAESV